MKYLDRTLQTGSGSLSRRSIKLTNTISLRHCSSSESRGATGVHGSDCSFLTAPDRTIGSIYLGLEAGLLLTRISSSPSRPPRQGQGHCAVDVANNARDMGVSKTHVRTLYARTPAGVVVPGILDTRIHSLCDLGKANGIRAAESNYENKSWSWRSRPRE